ncbi:methylation-associated defense system protein MAD4 [Micromonospora sp. 050-3]|uniref:methylation-associated defense system protein MAD4 n=1 Tax=Micromonospora sp. 050-3 TaxID=2789265 RepID=UPI0039791AC3
MRDVIFLVADGSMQQLLHGFLGRPEFHRSVGCQRFAFDPRDDVVVSPTKDPGVYRQGPEVLRRFRRSHDRAVIMLDNDWQGTPGPEKIYNDLNQRMRDTWAEFAVILIEPELEAWVWQDNPRVAQALNCPANFRQILADSGHWPRDRAKPARPKEALEHLRDRYRDLRRDGHKVDRSPALFKRLAAGISVRGCVDPAFLKLRDTLRDWFPEEEL